MAWVKSVATFRDFLSLVIVHAPDEFPREDYLEDDDQLDLQTAFADLRSGLSLLVRDKQLAEAALQKLSGLLESSLRAYEDGDDVRGAHVLQEFEAMAFA